MADKTTTPHVAQPPAAAANAADTGKSKTRVIINGKTFETKNMSAADGALLYAELAKLTTKTNYYELATLHKGLALSFKSLESLKFPIDDKYVKGFLTALKAGGGKLKGESEARYKEFMNTEVGRYIVQNELYESVEGTVSTISNIASFGRGFLRPAGTLITTAGAVVGTGGEVAAQAGFSISEAQATAIGAAFAGAYYMQGPDGPIAETRHRDPNIFDKGFAWVAATFDHFWRMLPPEWVAYLSRFVTYAAGGFKDWDGSYDVALKEAREHRASPELTAEQRLEKNITESIDKQNRPEAAEVLRLAGTIAGVNTAPIADAIKHGAIVRTQDGAFNSLTFEGGKPTLKVLEDGQGKPLTMANRIVSQWTEVGQAAMPKDRYDAAGLAAGLTATALVERTRLAPLRHSSNGLMHALGFVVTAPVDAVSGVLGGAAKGASSLVSWALPSQAGIEKFERAQKEAVDAAGKAAEAEALKSAKKTGLQGDALKEMVERARDAAREGAAAELKPRSAFSRAFDGLRSTGDAVRNFGTRAEALAGSFSNLVHGAVDVVKEPVLFDTRTAAKRTADAGAANAKKVIDEAVEHAPPKPASPTMGERWAAFKDRLMNRNSAGSSAQTATTATTAAAQGGANASTQAAAEAAKKAAEQTAHLAEEAIKDGAEVVAKEAAKEAAKVGAVFKLAKGVGRIIPGVGALFTVGGVVFGTSARADTINGEKLTYFKQLDHDHKLGKVSDKEYAYYRSLQTGYMASGLGGFVTAGATEAAQNGLEYADPVKMDKYLPESIVATVKGLIGSKPTGALPADRGLAAAGVAAEQARIAAVAANSRDDMDRARMAANRMTGRPGISFFGGNVAIGSTVASLPTPAGSVPQGNVASLQRPTVGA